MGRTSITLELPDELYQRAQDFAELVSQDVGEALIEMLSLSLPHFSPERALEASAAETPVTALSDPEVLALTELTMEPVQDQRLSELLERQQAGTLKITEKPELWALMQTYQINLVRQAQALRVAVERGLRKPLNA